MTGSPTRGVLYLHAGSSHTERLLVSVSSLRDVYAGPVRVVCVGQPGEELAAELHKLRCDIKIIPKDGWRPTITKASIWRHTPFDVSMFIDADTVILKPIEGFFELIEKHGFVVPQFSSWTTSDGPMPGRIRPFFALCSEAQLSLAKRHPAVSVGVFGFLNKLAMLRDWEAMARRAASVCRTAEEVSCQVLLQRHRHHVAPACWCESAKFPTGCAPVVVHYHSGKHNKDYPLCEYWKIWAARLSGQTYVPVPPEVPKRLAPVRLTRDRSERARRMMGLGDGRRRRKERVLPPLSSTLAPVVITDNSSRPENAGISIIVPAWKADEFIERMLQSFYKQDNKYGTQMEILIGVDGCADTRRKLAKLKLPNWVRVFWFPENHGPYLVINTLATKAKHPYLMFFGADDTALPQLLDQHRVARANADAVQQLIEGRKRACGAIGIWKDAFHQKMGGYLPWRCQADSEFNHRARRMGLRYVVTARSTMRQGRHDNQLTRREDTGMNSSLRRRYKWLQHGEFKDLAKIVPETAFCVPQLSLQDLGGAASALTACLGDSIAVVAAMATLPDREPEFHLAVDSLINQVDALVVGFNYGQHPLPGWVDQYPNLCWYVFDNSMGDAIKFCVSDKLEGYQLMCDDDLIYPDNYVEMMLGKVEQYRRKAVITLAGSTINRRINNYYTDRKEVGHALHDLDQDQFSNVGGTGVMAFHSSTMKIPLDELPLPNMADVHIAVYCQQRQIPILCAAHKADFMIYPRTMYKKPTIWKINDRAFTAGRGPCGQAQMLNKIEEWRVFECSEVRS